LCAKITGKAQRASGKRKKTYKTCYTRISHDGISCLPRCAAASIDRASLIGAMRSRQLTLPVPAS
jgi:hypothetical protein